LESDISSSLRKKLAPTFDKVKWAAISEDEVRPFLQSMNQKDADRVVYTVKSNESTKSAIAILKKRRLPMKKLRSILGADRLQRLRGTPNKALRMRMVGAIMNYQHELLRDLYDVSLPELESVRSAALDAGAYGVKILGAGLGGSLIALVDSTENGPKFLQAAKAAGARQGWISSAVLGARIERGKTPFDR
jgi:galactokinase